MSADIITHYLKEYGSQDALDDLASNGINTNPSNIMVIALYRLIDDSQLLIKQHKYEIHSAQFIEIISNHFKILRNLCSKGKNVQNLICNLNGLFSDIVIPVLQYKVSLTGEGNDMLKRCWEFIANLCVQNASTQQIVWQHLGEIIIESLKILNDCTNICLMIVYNIYLLQKNLFTSKKVHIIPMLLHILRGEKSFKNKLDFLYIFLEYLITSNKQLVPEYRSLEQEDRILFLQYTAEYLRIDSHQQISTIYIEYISKEFKKKSDCILKTLSNYVDNINPREVVSLLTILSTASGQQSYLQILSSDSSLFINAGCMLLSLCKIGNENENIFTPIRKIDRLAPTSVNVANSAMEAEISFDLKTMLVRFVGNCLFRNRKNQELARELDIISALLDCSNMDARNPLILQWSIMAIRNMCENNLENQQFIASMIKVGDYKPDVVKEFDLDVGSLRIG